MKGRVQNIRLDAVLEISLQDAEVLDWLMGYSMDEFVTFLAGRSQKYSKEQVDATVRRLRRACGHIVSERDKFVTALETALREKPPSA